MALNTTWHVAPDGVTYYTLPREYSIERLPNGFFRLYRYGSGLSSLHKSLVDAYKAARSGRYYA
jgi:hypothetical protein